MSYFAQYPKRAQTFDKIFHENFLAQKFPDLRYLVSRWRFRDYDIISLGMKLRSYARLREPTSQGNTLQIERKYGWG